MGRITITDLPEDQKISTEEMRKVFGGIFIENMPQFWGTRLADPRPSPILFRGNNPIPMP